MSDDEKKKPSLLGPRRGLTHREIGELLGCSKQAVQKAEANAMRKLRERFTWNEETGEVRWSI